MLLMAAGLLAALVGRTLLQLAVAHVLAAAATLHAGGVRRRPGVRPRRDRARGPLAVAARVRRSSRSRWASAELMNAILQRADIVLLTAFVGPSATAVYAASEFISRVIGNARYVFDGIAAPVFSEALHLGQRERLHQQPPAHDPLGGHRGGADRGDGGGAAPRAAVAVRPRVPGGRRRDHGAGGEPPHQRDAGPDRLHHPRRRAARVWC